MIRPTKGEINLAFGLGARNGLRQREQQRHVAIDALALEDFRRAHAFPRRRDFDEDALAPDAVRLVKLDEPVRLVDQAVGVKREIGVRFGRNAARHDFQNLDAEQHQQIVHDAPQQFFPAGAGFFVFSHRLVHEEPVFRHLRGLEDERGIGRGVLRRVLFERGEIAGVGDDRCELFELVELVQRR